MIFMNFIYSNKKNCVAINLRDLQSNVNWKGVVTSAEGITQSSIIYLHSRKSKHLHVPLHIEINENTCWHFSLFLFHHFISLFFHFCHRNHFEIIRCIVKLLITTSTYVLKHNWKKKTWSIFWAPNFRHSNWYIPVSQMTWMCH